MRSLFNAGRGEPDCKSSACGYACAAISTGSGVDWLAHPDALACCNLDEQNKPEQNKPEQNKPNGEKHACMTHYGLQACFGLSEKGRISFCSFSRNWTAGIPSSWLW